MELERFVIDSSVFVALYYSGDSNHKNALKIFSDLEAKTLIVHPYVIQETATVLVYKLGHKTAVSFLNDIENAANVVVPFLEITEDMKNFIAVGKRLSFTDTALIGLARRTKAQLVTFDNQMLSHLKQWPK